MNKVKNLLMELRLVLCNDTNGYNHRTTDYKVASSGVPYVDVDGKYHIVYFGKTKLFRVFDSRQKKTDFTDRGDLLRHFREMRREATG